MALRFLEFDSTAILIFQKKEAAQAFRGPKRYIFF
jgi:hypothetical protein